MERVSGEAGRRRQVLFAHVTSFAVASVAFIVAVAPLLARKFPSMSDRGYDERRYDDRRRDDDRRGDERERERDYHDSRGPPPPPPYGGGRGGGYDDRGAPPPPYGGGGAPRSS